MAAVRRIPLASIVALGALALGGCVLDGSADAGRPDMRAAIARGEMKSPRAAALSLASIEGAPGPVVARFEDAMATEAQGHEITMASDPAAARYFVRGYLDAYPTDGGTAVHYVWDIYDADKHHARRLDDALTIASAGSTDASADPWAALDDRALARLAARSTDDIAAFLSQTPEAAGAETGEVAAAR